MKRKIHITESQLKEILERMNEEETIDVDMSQAAEDGGAPKVRQEFKNKQAAMGSAGTKARAIIGSSAVENLEEIKYTVSKKQIKEARLNQLIKESVKMLKKKNINESWADEILNDQ